MVVSWPPASPVGAAAGVRKDASTKLSKRISWLNHNARLKTQIRFNEVIELLESLGEAEAMRVLKEVEERGATLNDPTLYVKSAVNAKRARNSMGLVGTVPQGGSPHGARMPATRPGSHSQGQLAMHSGPPDTLGGMSDDELQQDLWNRIEWMNAQGGLKKPLDFDRVYSCLAALGHSSAHDVLSKLEQQANKVNDPTGWLVVSASRKQSEQNHSTQQQRTAGSGWEMSNGSDGQQNGHADIGNDQLTRTLQDRMDFLNANVPLAAPLNIERVMGALRSIGETEGMRVLQILEQMADTVRDPTGWVLVAASKKPPQALLSASGRVALPDDEKLRRRIEWLNQNVALAAQLSYERLAPLLLGLSTPEAMDILKKLESEASTIRDPNGYVEATAKRRKLNGSEGATRSYSSVSPPGAFVPVQSVPVVPMVPVVNPEKLDKLRRHIGWLNHNAGLASPVRWTEVSSALSQIELSQGMHILKGLEEKAKDVREPTAYVLASARNALGAHHPPNVNAETDQKIRRRIGWLNGNVPFSKPLMYDKVIGDLLRIKESRALAILKEVEEQELDSDPTAWVIQQARQPRGQVTVDEPSDTRLSKRISWLNDKAGLCCALDADVVLPALLELDIRNAMVVLKRLEENANTVSDPTSYVLTACLEVGSEVTSNAQSPGLENASPDTSTPVESWEADDGSRWQDSTIYSPEDLLWYAVERLNGSKMLLAPLSYEEISPSLLAAEKDKAAHILELLEKDAQYIEDPNAFVIAEAQAYLASGNYTI